MQLFMSCHVILPCDPNWHKKCLHTTVIVFVIFLAVSNKKYLYLLILGLHSMASARCSLLSDEKRGEASQQGHPLPFLHYLWDCDIKHEL